MLNFDGEESKRIIEYLGKDWMVNSLRFIKSRTQVKHVALTLDWKNFFPTNEIKVYKKK